MTMAEFETATLYVELDALFDTRMVVLKSFGLDAIETHVPRGYYTRVIDSFGDITLEAFEERYAKRNINTLREALITPVAGHIYDFARRTLIALVSSPFRRQPKVFVNTYPYQLDEVSAASIVEGLKIVTKNTIDIEVAYLPLEKITPQYVKDNYIQMVMYSYWEWLETHAKNKNWETTRCPEITLIGPRVIRSMSALRDAKVRDVFGVVETYSRVFVKLQLYPVNFFSADVTRIKERLKEKSAT